MCFAQLGNEADQSADSHGQEAVHSATPAEAEPVVPAQQSSQAAGDTAGPSGPDGQPTETMAAPTAAHDPPQPGQVQEAEASQSDWLAQEWSIAFDQREVVGPPPANVVHCSGGECTPLHAAFYLGYSRNFIPPLIVAQAQRYLPALIQQAKANMDIMTGDTYFSAGGLRAVHFACLHRDRKPLNIFIGAFGDHPGVMSARTDPRETYGLALPPVLLYLISGKDWDDPFWPRALRPSAGQPNTISRAMFERSKDLYR